MCRDFMPEWLHILNALPTRSSKDEFLVVFSSVSSFLSWQGCVPSWLPGLG